MKITGIGSVCTKKEIDAYNTFASDCYPKTFADVQNIVSFVNKICDDRVFERYFDKFIVRHLFANLLCGGSYHAIDKKELKDSAIAARKKVCRQMVFKN